ncbi:MAG: signal peptidase I [Anaerolineales bacterium]|nr:signal peptidase I [Anaerolineales bacterium]
MEYFRSEIFPDTEPPDEKKTRRILRELVETIVLSLILFVGINAVSARIRVESISMQKTLYAGYLVVVNKLAYAMGEPSRGDIIVFYPPDPSEEPFIKRVIGLPGEEVRVDDGIVYINGAALEEPYIKASPEYSGTWNVPMDSLFVLGDNRNSSFDSHSWGMVSLSKVIGKAEFVYWPPSAWKLLNTAAASAGNP